MMEDVIDRSNKEKIEKLTSSICSAYGEGVNDYFNDYVNVKMLGKKMTIEEFSSKLNEDGHLKFLMANASQNTLKKIQFWITFWSICSILAVVLYLGYRLFTSGSSYY